MNQARLRPRSKRNATEPVKAERKRKTRPSISEEEFDKKQSLLQTKDINTEPEEILEAFEVLSTAQDNICAFSLFINQPEKRRKSSKPCIYQKELKNNTQQNKKKDSQNTPNELIKGITKFTFSNYFSPISKDCSPLPNLNWADSYEVWEVMLQKDREYKRDSLYIRRHPSLQPRMRTVLLDWLIEVCEVYRLHRETFYLAVDYVDRFLSTQKNIAKTRLQLVGVTAIFVASKMEEIYPPKLSEFAFVTDGACTDEEILQQEMILLSALNWHLCPVTPICWLTSYLQIANRKLRQEKQEIDESFHLPQFSGIHLARVTELVDLCCLDTGYLQFSYSIIAASALYHMWGKDISDITGHKYEELYPCIQWLTPFAKVIHMQPIKPIKQFEKVSSDNAHNIQVHNNAIQLLDFAHSQMINTHPVNNHPKTSPLVKCKGILTPPQSTEKEFL
ncbi:G1/S-specific cyclin-E1 isoform X1 [Hydra vulgaris]|uniref:G1/S-specific cyclin-E1 isoform X1 n=1 Tax=Hydra vulgaris TaxID=6087 RepID=UPI0002B4A193|nr:G1/S-specific cyclin-E1 [Hydra vulgaris]